MRDDFDAAQRRERRERFWAVAWGALFAVWVFVAIWVGVKLWAM